MDISEADYVVVGGGTAGSVLAARLSEDRSARVVLVEAGALSGPPEIAAPHAWPRLLGGPVDWGFLSAPQSALSGRVLPYPRGKVLGGTSAINGMMHLRAHRGNYDLWGGGIDGWGYHDLLPYFRRSESAPGRDSEYRGVDGPMVVTVPSRRNAFERSVLDATTELGLPVSPDLNGEHQEGVGWVEQNIVNGRRQSASDGYLGPIRSRRANLTVVGDASVSRLLFDGTVCTGVEVLHSGQRSVLRAAREVVLCCGAIGTPQLLMCSGVGSANQLRQHGIGVVVDLPEVGRNLREHPMSRIVRGTDDAVGSGSEVHGLLTAMLPVAASDGLPDVQLFFWDVPDFPVGQASGYSVGVAVLRPRGRGSVSLVSADPAVSPVIDPGLLTDAEDARVLAEGLRVAREFADAKAMKAWGASARRADEDRPEYLAETTHNGMHPAGTCRLGTDDAAVVDTELRVRGVSRLRVADASVMPDLVGANPNATILAIAERAADLVRGVGPRRD